jgi:hypothetical protein
MKKLIAAKGRVVITLPHGIPIAGNVRSDNKSNEAHDIMCCNILILSDNNTEVCLLGFDASFPDFTYLNHITDKIENAAGISATNIIMWTSETISDTVAFKRSYPVTEDSVLKAYTKEMADKVVAGVKKAKENYEEVKLKVGKKNITDIAGVDRELITLSAWDKNDKLFALLVRFTQYPAIFGDLKEAQREYKKLGTSIKDSIRDSSVLDGKIRFVSEKVTSPLQKFPGGEMILQGMAVHNFALIAVPGEVNDEFEKKIKELSPYKNTMIISLTGNELEPDTGDTIIDLVKEKILGNLLKQSVKLMERKASDNKYLHKDFHIALNLLMTYIYDHFGKDALVNYLKQYSRAYHKPLIGKLKSGDKEALVKYFRGIYEKEDWSVNIISAENSVEITQDACPAISHIVLKGGKPCPFYLETYNTVYKTICENTPFEYNLVYFNEETGACKQMFIIKEVKQ